MPLRTHCNGECTFKVVARPEVDGSSLEGAADDDADNEAVSLGFGQGAGLFGGNAMSFGTAGNTFGAAPGPSAQMGMGFGGGFGGGPAFGGSSFGATSPFVSAPPPTLGFGGGLSLGGFGASPFGAGGGGGGLGAVATPFGAPPMASTTMAPPVADDDGSVEVQDAAAAATGDLFLDVDQGAQVLLQLPPTPSVGASDAQLKEQYSVTVVMRVMGLPPAGKLAALLRFSQPADVATRYRLCASLFLDDAGSVLTRDMLPGGGIVDEHGGGAPLPSAALGAPADSLGCVVRPGEWHVITVNVDCSTGQALVYVDGETSSAASTGIGLPAVSRELLALGSRITLLGGGKAAEHRGGHIRFVGVRRGALLTALQISRQVLLKDASLALPRILCLVEPAGVEDEVEQAATGQEWPCRNRRQCVWLESVRAAGRNGHSATRKDFKEDHTDAPSDDGPPEAERVVRLGSLEGGGQPTRLAFYAMPTASFTHAARHNLTKVEQVRVKQSKETQAITALEKVRAIKAARAAGFTMKKPTTDEEVALAAKRVVLQTKAIDEAPRLARMEDILDGPLLHGLNPPFADKPTPSVGSPPAPP